MAGKNVSVKRVLVDKANSQIVVVTSIASFVVIFCLVSSFYLFGQLTYQAKVISKKNAALEQIEEDKENVATLRTSYKAFVETNLNLIGGMPSGPEARDGDNAKIVLDALPSKYDFPALATSLENLLSQQGVEIQNITGSDDEVAQSNSESNAKPQAIAMPFELTASGNYQSVQNVVDGFNRSIRPIQIQNLKVQANADKITLITTAQTFYQPEKTLKIRSEVVK